MHAVNVSIDLVIKWLCRLDSGNSGNPESPPSAEQRGVIRTRGKHAEDTRGQTMKRPSVEELLGAGEVLTALQDEFVAAPSEQRAATVAATCLAMANTYIAELARHLAEGKPRETAIKDTLLGAMELVKKQAPKLEIIQGGLDQHKK